MAQWVISAKRADFKAIAEEFGIDQVTARIIRNRDIEGMENIRKYLYGTLADIPSPHLLKDADKAADILVKKIGEEKKIRILGDYDIDGVSATYILHKSLTTLGAVADYYIPDRILDGYGINDHLIDAAIADRVDTIITCDNGISAYNEISRAKEAGITVIVTDHHEVPYDMIDGEKIYRIPPADAVVNPKQQDCGYPAKNICGAVVAFKLMCVLFDHMNIPLDKLDEFVEIEAIATVGDVMDLQGENRILVKEGLKRLVSTRNKGLRALIKACDLENKPITAYHIGFVIGPCINASGRLDTAARSLALLESDSVDEAAKLARDLHDLNVTRKAMTEEGCVEAERLIEENHMDNDKVLVVYLPECHESLAGIIAGRIREKHYKPAFVMTKGEHAVKGSGRSIEAYSMYDEMNKCADLFLHFGGHPMAAGFSVAEENVEELRRRLNEECTLTEKELTPKTVIDVAVPFSYLSKKFIKELALLEPFGKENRKPVFAMKELRVLYPKIVGKNKNVVRMMLKEKNGFKIDAVYFGEPEPFMERLKSPEPITVTYYPEINVYNDRESIQAVVTDFR